ncbi:hypothetical protein ACSMX9_13595 [Streptomyces sp. LE64]|uniref:hypothetical protein n=1 Tax=Streptomyces sp. LE64 TaxID=3448653 RepID=UPI004040EFC8
MAVQIVFSTKPTVESTPTTTPSARGFAPQVNTHPVGTLTLGRQSFNDSDKANYFEG